MDTEDNFRMPQSNVGDFVKDWTKVRYREVKVSITASNQLEDKSYQLDRDIDRIIACQIQADRVEQAWFRGSFRLELDNKEIYPTDYSVKSLMAGNECPPQERFTIVNRGAGNGNVNFRYQDTNHFSAVFAPYSVTLVLMCEIDSQR